MKFNSKMLFTASIFIFSSIYISGCSNDLVNINKQIESMRANFEKQTQENMTNFMKGFEEVKETTNTFQSIKKSLSENNPNIVTPDNSIKQESINLNKFPSENKIENNYSEQNDLHLSNEINNETFTNLEGIWKYNVLGQKIEVRVHKEGDNSFSTNALFNSYNYEATGEISKISNNSIIADADYYGDKLKIKLEPYNQNNMKLTILEGGVKIPEIVKGLPLLFQKG